VSKDFKMFVCFPNTTSECGFTNAPSENSVLV